ncbi:RDD family protein, partial [Propionibacterium freudenreichii]|nr:RDD family protein [Propionibacterium freudenreichii]
PAQPIQPPAPYGQPGWTTGPQQGPSQEYPPQGYWGPRQFLGRPGMVPGSTGWGSA